MAKGLLDLAEEIGLSGEKFEKSDYKSSQQGSEDRTYECVCVDCNGAPDNCDCA